MSHRTQIMLADEQYERLVAEAARTGVSLGELIRRAVDRVYGANGADAVLVALGESFGAWNGRADDGEAYVEGLRKGMAQRLGSQP